MKIHKVLRKYPGSSFFRFESISVCRESISSLSGANVMNWSTVSLTLSTKNPKKKGFRKVSWKYHNAFDPRITIGDKTHVIIWDHLDILKSANVEENQPFWLKAEKV